MDVFFKTENGLKFRIELGYWDTVLDIKKKIKKYKRIPVLIQTLFFQGNVLQNHLNIEQCNILHKSRVKVLFNRDQILQPEQPPIPSKPIEDIIYSEYFPLKTKDFKHIKIYLPPEETKGIINGNKESTVTAQTEENQVSSSKSIKKKKKNQDSRKNAPKKRLPLRVLLPYSGAKNFTVFVRMKDQVRKLRKLVQNRVRDQAWVRDGYFFKHKERILYEDESFEWNGVDRFSSTINIVPDPWLFGFK